MLMVAPRTCGARDSPPLHRPLRFGPIGGIWRLMSALPIDLDAFEAAAVAREPFAFVMVPHFVRREAMAAINADYPPVRHPGSFPLPTLKYGPAFKSFIDAIQVPEFTRAVVKKLGVNLRGRP